MRLRSSSTKTAASVAATWRWEAARSRVRSCTFSSRLLLSACRLADSSSAALKAWPHLIGELTSEGGHEERHTGMDAQVFDLQARLPRKPGQKRDQIDLMDEQSPGSHKQAEEAEVEATPSPGSRPHQNSHSPSRAIGPLRWNCQSFGSMAPFWPAAAEAPVSRPHNRSSAPAP